MQRKKNSARSPVTEYVKNGTPILSTSRAGTPQRERSASHAAGAAAVHSEARARSPWERSQTPDTFLAGRWKSGGVTCTGFDTIRKQTLKLRPQMAKQEQRAHDIIEKQREKVVEKSFVPRVAKLALVYQIPESARSLSRSPSGAAPVSARGAAAPATASVAGGGAAAAAAATTTAAQPAATAAAARAAALPRYSIGKRSTSDSPPGPRRQVSPTRKL